VSGEKKNVTVRPMEPADFPGVIGVCLAVYPTSPPWREEQLASHLRVFPEGQLVAADSESGRILGVASSLIIRWDDYEPHANWKDFTASGMFTNHDPAAGRTLYGAEVMVHPEAQGRGVGGALYEGRRALARRFKLLRIRAGARLRGYHEHAAKMTPLEYVLRVVQGELRDPTLSFQLRHGFHVFGIVAGYLGHDPDSLGFAALIEWINDEMAREEDTAGRDRAFAPKR